MKVESTRVVDGLDLGGGRREVKDDANVYGLSYYEAGTAMTERRKTLNRTDFGAQVKT